MKRLDFIKALAGMAFIPAVVVSKTVDQVDQKIPNAIYLKNSGKGELPPITFPMKEELKGRPIYGDHPVPLPDGVYGDVMIQFF